MNDNDHELPREAIVALERGSKIEAIKCVRVTRGVGLKDAKEIVEQFLEQQPRLQQRMTSANIEIVRGKLGWFVLAAMLAVLAHYFLTG
ncbi:ribosomal protein L7/L12 [Accumulibacter sp.]|uniref:ribosomal protein L7/L12 n=1 Tax=Accumulibacter sp. TaxID=2053492 RepID=UPI002613F957|nr:ribosomal protein L7/L12 [Accumulibacter sp.]